MAIGAGLKDRGIPRKKKNGRYVEPGSSWGCLLPVFIVLALYGLVRYQPWNENWEMIRSWFGQGQHHSIEGSWQVAQVVHLKNSPDSLVGNRQVQSGELDFKKDGTLALALDDGSAPINAHGVYLVDGVLVAINGLVSDGDVKLPIKLKLQLAWTGPDQVVASTGAEAIYLKRKGGGALDTLTMGLKPGAESKGSALMRGRVTTIQNEIKDSNG